MASPAKRAKPSSPAKPPAAPPPDDAAVDPRVLLRRRWELASVLNFLRVFEPVVEGDLGLSSDDIETAFITGNRDLARIHISLLKGIPPVSKNLKADNGWIINTAKKLSDWWSWVAEGVNPFGDNPGKEVETYKQQDPVKRLLILKALCDVRSEQNDAVWYVNDEMKKGIDISNFRKEKLGSGGNGTIYWYDGDSTIGHRLYKENVTVNYKQNWKGKHGRLTEPVINTHWETVATNLDDFLEISEKLCSKARAESAIGEHLKTEIIPAVEKFEKKKLRKERQLKLQQEKEELLALANDFKTRSLRQRKPVSYSYSDYDRSINEAIKVTAQGNETDSQEACKKEKHAPIHGDRRANGGSDMSPKHNEGEGQGDENYLDDLSSNDDEDGDYNDNGDSSSDSEEDVDAYDPRKGDLEEEGAFVTRKRTRLAARAVDSKPRQGLRRSQRNVKISEEILNPGQVTPRSMTKKTTRQRPTPISKQFSLSGSEDDLTQTVADSEEESESQFSSSGSDDDLTQTAADSEEESDSP